MSDSPGTRKPGSLDDFWDDYNENKSDWTETEFWSRARKQYATDKGWSLDNEEVRAWIKEKGTEPPDWRGSSLENDWLRLDEDQKTRVKKIMELWDQGRKRDTYKALERLRPTREPAKPTPPAYPVIPIKTKRKVILDG